MPNKSSKNIEKEFFKNAMNYENSYAMKTEWKRSKCCFVKQVDNLAVQMAIWDWMVFTIILLFSILSLVPCCSSY